MSQSIITLGIGGVSDLDWFITSGLHTALSVSNPDPDNFVFMRYRERRHFVTARNKRAAIAYRSKLAIVG